MSINAFIDDISIVVLALNFDTKRNQAGNNSTDKKSMFPKPFQHWVSDLDSARPQNNKQYKKDSP